MATQSQPIGADAPEITYPLVAKALILRVKWFETEKSAIQNFAQASRKAGEVPDLSIFKHSRNIERTRGWLDLLEYDTVMSPGLKNSKARIQEVLELINRPGIFFPEDVKLRAERLLARFQAENWGAAAATSDNDDEEEEEEVTSPTTAAAPAAHVGAPVGGTVTIRLPPPTHRIWGQNGIMHGIAVTQNGKKKLDPRYQNSRRSAKVSGHNGLKIGAWFPTRLSALFHGAHGHSQAGITGNTDYGAFSIVVATTYKDVDDDRGETIWYSAPGSAENEDRDVAPDKTGTGHLQRSLTTRNPVRVLRAAKKKSAYAPSVGIRYDGLYVVTKQETAHNPKGGLYFKYLLERIPDQKPLAEIRKDSPTSQQMADFQLINDLW